MSRTIRSTGWFFQVVNGGFSAGHVFYRIAKTGEYACCDFPLLFDIVHNENPLTGAF